VRHPAITKFVADDGTDPGARALASRLNGFPLALATAGAFLRQTPIDCATYLQRYEECWQVAHAPVNQLPEYRNRTLYMTWSLSLEQVKRQMPRAAQLLAFFAYLDHQDISYDLLCVGTEIDQPSWFRELTRHEFALLEATTILAKCCLVESHHESNSYSLHTLCPRLDSRRLES